MELIEDESMVELYRNHTDRAVNKVQWLNSSIDSWVIS